MKRMILRVVVMLLTFALGIVVDWLILRRAVNNTPPPCQVEAVSPAPVAQPVVAATPVLPLPVATPDPYFILDYDPEMFNPYGTYYMMGPKPKEFANFDNFDLAFFGYENDPGYINVFTGSSDNNGSDTASAVFAFATDRRLFFATSPNSSGVEYRFEGEFLRTDFMSVAGKNKAVLRGVLTRSKNGQKLAEHPVSFRIEYHGC